MTVVAWDGQTLAADRQATVNGTTRSTGAKIRYLRKTGEAIAAIGTVEHGLELLDWYAAGHKKEDFPPRPDDPDDCATLIVAGKSGVSYCVGRTPVLIPLLDEKFAWGSGGDVALGALLRGATAEEAVAAACAVNIYCGMGCVAYIVRKKA